MTRWYHSKREKLKKQSETASVMQHLDIRDSNANKVFQSNQQSQILEDVNENFSSKLYWYGKEATYDLRCHRSSIYWWHTKMMFCLSIRTCAMVDLLLKTAAHSHAPTHVHHLCIFSFHHWAVHYRRQYYYDNPPPSKTEWTIVKIKI